MGGTRRSIFVRFDAERRWRGGRVSPPSSSPEREPPKTESPGGVDRSVRNWRLSVRCAGFSVGCQRSPWAPPARMEPTRVPRAPGPRLVFLVGTLALTFAGNSWDYGDAPPRRTLPSRSLRFSVFLFWLSTGFPIGPARCLT